MAYPKKTLYEILGVAPDASGIDIGLAYRRRKGQLERVVGGDPNELALIHEAWEVLGDPQRRASYDASLVTAEARHAVAEAKQEAPDLELEPEAVEAPPRKKLPAIALAMGVVVVGLLVAVAFKPPRNPPPAQAEAEAPKPAPVAPPPPPTPRSAAEVLADFSTSGGVLMSYSMSGQAIPLGLAVSTETGSMLTTCHGLPAGAKLVVRVGAQSHPADLLITDEQLDLCKLQVANFQTPPVKVAAAAAKAGDKVYAVGANKAGQLAVTEGTVKQLLPTTEGTLYELSMPVGEFSSGGGVFDAFGKLVGIATFQHRSGLATAYPATNFAQMRSRPAAATPPPAPPRG